MPVRNPCQAPARDRPGGSARVRGRSMPDSSTSSGIDPRIRRTRRQLQEAVLALAANRDFGAITVREITTRADVNRATFYLHYRDKDDLVAQTLDALFDEFTAEDRAFADAHGRVSPATVPPPVVD